MSGCANRDKDTFESGYHFDVTRSNGSKHLAFAQGIHFFPGAPLARLESVIAFERLFSRLRRFELDVSASELTHLPSFTH